MNIKSVVAGLIITTSMITAGAGYACFVRNQPACASCTVIEGFTGKGWHTVPCDTCIPPAPTWQLYVSGGYAPPVVSNKNLFFFGY